MLNYHSLSFVIRVKVVKRVAPSSHDPVKLFEIQHSITISISFL